MSKIILIETSTALCSTALSIDGEVVEYRESSEPKAHASLTAVFIKEMLDARGLKVSDCDAVCVSSGPGSYTGLRVGVSTAKGLCFAAGIKLLSVCTLDVLVEMGLDQSALNRAASADRRKPVYFEEIRKAKSGGLGTNPPVNNIVPLIDARRMEVYTATYTAAGEQLSEVEAHIVESGDWAEELKAGPVLFIGDGAEKCRPLLECDNSYFVQTCPKASAMARLAEREFSAKNFRDIAYFEPFYLKQFTATVSKKKLF